MFTDLFSNIIDEEAIRDDENVQMLDITDAKYEYLVSVLLNPRDNVYENRDYRLLDFVYKNKSR